MRCSVNKEGVQIIFLLWKEKKEKKKEKKERTGLDWLQVSLEMRST